MKRILAEIIIVFGLTNGVIAGNIPAFESSSQKQLLQRSLELALSERSYAEFEAKVQQVAMTAYMLWEKEALAVWEQQLHEGTSDLDEELNRLKADARQKIQQMLEETQGRFDARCAEIVMPQYAKDELIERIQQMGAGDPFEDMMNAYYAWDESIGRYAEELLRSIVTSLWSQRQQYVDEIADQVEAYRKGFIQGIDERIAILHKEAKRDVELYSIGAKNAYIWEHFGDNKSLRMQSEMQSAEAITSKVLYDTQVKADAIYAAVADKLMYTEEGIGIAPEGDDVEELVRAGMYAWKAASDKLIVERINWEKTAAESYDQMDAVWADAYTALLQKRSEWISAIQQQIRHGAIEWSNSFFETDQRYADSLRLLDETIQSETERFNDYSQSMRQLITTGSRSLAVAHENITWLSGYFTTLTGLEYKNDANTLARIQGILAADTSQTKQLKQAVYDQLTQWYTITGQYNDIVRRMALQYHSQDMWSTPVTVLKAGSFIAQYTGEEQEFARQMAVFRALYDEIRLRGNNLFQCNSFTLNSRLQHYVSGIQFVQVLRQHESNSLPVFDTVVKEFAQRMQYDEDQIASIREYLHTVYDAYMCGETSQLCGSLMWMLNRLQSFAHYVADNQGSFENLYGYLQILNSQTGLLSDERFDDEGNPLYEYYVYKDTEGVVIIDGIYQHAHDPYLMTTAEYDLEKEKITLAYWEERLRRAQKLYQYAYNEEMRPDATAQKQQLQQAVEEYNHAKQQYNDAMALLSGQLKDALISAQKNVDSAQDELSQVRMSYEAAQEAYRLAMERCLYYTNPDAREMAQCLMQEATKHIIELRNSIEGKERALIQAKKEYYASLLLQDTHSQAAEYARRVELAVKILEGYSTQEEEVSGVRALYHNWQNICNKPLDEALAAIERNTDVLSVTIEDILPGYEHDERLTYIQEGLTLRDSYWDTLLQAKQRYEAWNTIRSIQTPVHILQEVMIQKLNEAEHSMVPQGITWNMIQEQIDCIADVTVSVEERKRAIELLTYYTGGCVDSKALEQLIDECPVGGVGNRVVEIVLGSVLDTLYGVHALTIVDSSTVYPTADVLYHRYESIIKDEYELSRVNTVYAVNAFGKVIQDIYQSAYNVVVYLLHDMSSEDMASSPFTKNAVLQAAHTAFNNADVTYYERNRDTVQTLIDILNHKKQILASDGDVEWSGFEHIADELMDNCMNMMSDTTVHDALKYSYLYTLIGGLKDTLVIRDDNTFSMVVSRLQGIADDLSIVINLYTDEIAQCKDNDDIDELLKQYTKRLSQGTDDEGNPLSFEQIHQLQVKVTALMQPDVFDMVHPVAYEGNNSAWVMDVYARYVDKFYEVSLEAQRRVKDQGFIGNIASILGIHTDDISTIFSHSMTVDQLSEYGAKAERYIQTKEYAALPQALKEALQAVVSAYHDVLIQKAYYESRGVTSQQAQQAVDTTTSVLHTLDNLQKKYQGLIALRNQMYADEENEFAAKRNAYYTLQPNGVWPGYTDALIQGIKECEVQYAQVVQQIDSMQLRNIHSSMVAMLHELELLRQEYEYVDLTARYLMETGTYGSLQEYTQNLRSQGKDEALITEVAARIQKELQRRRDIETLMTGEADITQIQQQWEGDTTWVLAAYYEGLRNAARSTNFNALLYDEAYRDFALLEHFEYFLVNYIHDNGIASFETLVGTLDSNGNVTPGIFARLPQYAGSTQIATIISAHYEELQRIYYQTITGMLTADTGTITNVYTYEGHTTKDMYAHFIAYCTEVGINASFDDVFGMLNGTSWEPEGFAALVQYSDDTWQQRFIHEYDIFKHIFEALKSDRAIADYSYLPPDIRQYAIVSDYYTTVRQNSYVAPDAQTLLEYYGITTDDEDYERMQTEITGFMHVMDIASKYDRDRSITMQEYIKRYNITDERDKNFLILYSINPDLANPVNLIVADGKVPLILTGYQMQDMTDTLYTMLSGDEEDGLQGVLAMCIYAANRDNVIAQNVYQFVVAQRDVYNHWRDYVTTMQHYYDVTSDEQNPSQLYQVIIEKEHLKMRNAEGLDIRDQYYNDINNNSKYDEGEQTLRDYIQEYQHNGYDIAITKKSANSIFDVESDDLNSNQMGYYQGADSSYYNAMTERATQLAAAFDMLVDVAQMATQATNTFVLHDDSGNAEDISFIHSIDTLMQELTATEYDGTDIVDGTSDAQSQRAMILQMLEVYGQSVNDARIEELVSTMAGKIDATSSALQKAYMDIEKVGPLLTSSTLIDYMKSDSYAHAQEVYVHSKQLFEEAQAKVQNAMNAYYQAQDAYSRQLEIITILYNRLEEARKRKEDEEMLYAYASTPYLYNTLANADGGDSDDIESKLKADAKQQYELALKYHNEVTQRIASLQVEVENVKAQKVYNDPQYTSLKQELIERAQRAFRMEKTAYCMKNEIKALSIAYQEAAQKYETLKNEYMGITNPDFEGERNNLVDSMIQNSFLFSIRDHMNTAAYWYNTNYRLFGLRERVFTTEAWAHDITSNSIVRYALNMLGINTDYGLPIPDGSQLEGMQSPVYQYFNLMFNHKVTSNALFIQYFNSFLRARQAEHKLWNLTLLHAAITNGTAPYKRYYNYMNNFKISIFGHSIYPLRPAARVFYYSSGLFLFDRAADFIMYNKRPEALRSMIHNDTNARIFLTALVSKITQLQEAKIAMLKARATLARYTEIESLDDPQKAGVFEYYNPKTMQNVLVQKPTLKAALKEVAGKYGIMISDSDLQFMAEDNRGGDWLNVNNYRTTIQKTNANGYTTDEVAQVLNAGTVSQTYANLMNQQRRDCFARFMAHVNTMYTQGGYDRVVVDQAVEKDLYGIWAGDSSAYQSAMNIGPESKGVLRAMLMYMGVTEGIPVQQINQLDAMIGTDNESQVEALLAQYVKQYEGINDRELAQRRELQVHQWKMVNQQLQDKKGDWDRMVTRIFQRGMRQWDMMVKSFESRWKNWRVVAQQQMREGSKAWEDRIKKLEQEKIAWLVAAHSNTGYAQIHKQMTGIEIILNDMCTAMQQQYGNVIERVDVHTLLVDILKDQPQLISQEIMNLAGTQAEFGLTQLTTRTYNRALINDAQALTEQFEKAHKKTKNLALLKALTTLLEQCRRQVEAANEKASMEALQYVGEYDFTVDGMYYTRKLPVSGMEQKIVMYVPYMYHDGLVLGSYSIPMLMDLYQKDDGVMFGSTMNVVLSQVQTRMGMMMRPDVVWGLGYYIGQFGEIQNGPTLTQQGKGQLGRITREVYYAEKRKATEGVICQYANAGVAMTASIITANPLVGAAIISVGQAGSVATGEMSVQHWAMQTALRFTASYAGGYVGGATNSAVYGSLTTSAVQGLGNFVEYKQDGGLGLQWGSKQQWRSFGIGATTALVGAKLGQMYGDSWNNSWQQYGYTASSSYLVNRFDGTGDWKDDLVQSGASVAALWASNELLKQGTVLGNVASNTNAIAPMNRFIQGTLENIMLAGVQVGQGKSIHDALLEQNWAKTQYTMADYLSDYAAEIAQEHSEATRKMMEMEKKEGLLGLAWLGLRRAGSLLGSTWDGVSEFFEKGVNWLQGEGFITNKEIAVKAALEEFHRMGIEEAKAAALQEYGIQKGKEILDSFYTDSREKTDAKIWALKQAGYDTESLEGEIAKKRQALEEKKILEAEEAARKSGNSKQQVDKASILGDVYTSIGKGLEWLIKSLSREKENTDTALKRDGIEGIKKGAREVKPEEIQDLTLALNQAKDGPLKKAIQELIDEGKIKGKVDVVKMAQQGCVYASLYVDLVLVGASVEDIKGFVERWYNAGAIKADGTTYQGTIAKAYGYEVKRITDYNEFAKLMSNGGGMQYGVMKFYNENYKHEHNVNLYKYNGGWYVSDVGNKDNHGMSWDDFLGIEAKNKFRYYQYLIKK